MSLKAIGITTLMYLVDKHPNDADLGKAVREYVKGKTGEKGRKKK
jgi:hypothetical protein